MSQTEHEVCLTVNGRPVTRRVPARRLLSDFLRDDLSLTGTHVGCEHGVCGSCTVSVDGKTRRACLSFAVQLDGCEVRTVECLGTAQKLHPLQQAFWEKHGLQCGFCTPGMLMTAEELLVTHPEPTREQVREAISGNLCRCTGYETIVDAILAAAAAMRAQEVQA